MDDVLFIMKINEISRENRLGLPALKSGELPSAAFLGEWARFLEDCVKKGIALSDDRWQRLTLASRTPYAVFALENAGTARTDADFRVGLQLLMGLLEEQNSKE